MAVTTWTAGQVLAAADLNDTFASKLPYSYGTATPSTTDSGFLWYDSNSTPAAPKFWDGAAFQALGAPPLSATAVVNTAQSTTSVTYTDLATVGPSVTITTGTKALVIITGQPTTTGSPGAAFIGFDVSGANTIAASDLQSNGGDNASSNRPHLVSSSVFLLTGLTAGSSTFTLKYRVTAGTGTFVRRSIVVVDMGS